MAVRPLVRMIRTPHELFRHIYHLFAQVAIWVLSCLGKLGVPLKWGDCKMTVGAVEDTDLVKEVADKDTAHNLQKPGYSLHESTKAVHDSKSSHWSLPKLDSGKVNLRNYSTTILQQGSAKVTSFTKYLRLAITDPLRVFKVLGTSLFCVAVRVWTAICSMFTGIFLAVKVLVIYVFCMLVRVSWLCCDGVRVCLERLLLRWRDKERIVQEVQDRDMSQEVAEKFVCESGGEYRNLRKLPDLGSRLQKYWYRASTREDAEVIITVIKVSTRCAVDLIKDIKNINKKLLPEIQGPYLQPILEVKYYKDEDQLVMVQPFHQLGSLKDFIYQKSPTKDWSKKYYTFSRTPPPAHLIAKYGRHILQGILELYELGFVQLGHIQTGNMFLDGDLCLVGGYENTVFGYKTRLTTLLHDYRDAMDLIMFGHVIFELACGYELTTVSPGEEDWRRVRDDAVFNVLQFIFHTDNKGRFTSTIEKLMIHEFFNSIEVLPPVRRPRLPHVTNRGVKALLSKINKGVWSERRGSRCKVQ